MQRGATDAFKRERERGPVLGLYTRLRNHRSISPDRGMSADGPVNPSPPPLRASSARCRALSTTYSPRLGRAERVGETEAARVPAARAPARQREQNETDSDSQSASST